MTSNSPFGPKSSLFELLDRQREQMNLLKNGIGSVAELQSRFAAVQPALAHFQELEKSGVLGTAAMLREHSFTGSAAAIQAQRLSELSLLKQYTSPEWMAAIQSATRWIEQDPGGILRTQKAILGSGLPDWSKLASAFAKNQATLGKLLGTSEWAKQAQFLSERLSPNLEIIKLAAERARMLDVATLRAAATEVAASSTVIAAEQVLEAHRLIEAIGQSQDPEQGASLLVALASLMASIVERFGENTMREIGAIGAIRLFELFMVLMAFIAWMNPPELSPGERQAFAEMQAQVKAIGSQLEDLQNAQEAVYAAAINDLPRAELIRPAPIRRHPQGKAQILMRGDAGMLMAVKESHGRWRMIIYRDPLSNQLAQGWIYGPALRLLDAAD